MVSRKKVLCRVLIWILFGISDLSPIFQSSDEDPITYYQAHNKVLCKNNTFRIKSYGLINFEIPVLIRSLNPSNVELDYYLDRRLFQVLSKCCC